MSDYCTACGQTIVDLTPQEVGERLTKFRTMWLWEDYPVGHTNNVPGVGDVEVVYNSYLAADEGESIKMVWNTKYGYVGMDGYYSSYDGANWSGKFKKAEKAVQEVVYFE